MSTDKQFQVRDRIGRIALDADFATESVIANHLNHGVHTGLRCINLHFDWFPRTLGVPLGDSRLIFGFFLGPFGFYLFLVRQAQLRLASTDTKLLFFLIEAVFQVSLVYIIVRLRSVFIVSPAALILISLISTFRTIMLLMMSPVFLRARTTTAAMAMLPFLISIAILVKVLIMTVPFFIVLLVTLVTIGSMVVMASVFTDPVFTRFFSVHFCNVLVL